MSAVENLVEAGLVEGVGSGSSRSYMLSAQVYKRQRGWRLTRVSVTSMPPGAVPCSGVRRKNDGVVTTADVMDLFGLSYISAYRL